MSTQDHQKTPETVGCVGAWRALPEEGSLRWSVGEQTLRVSAWGWASGLERRALPRALTHMSLDPQRGLLILGGAGGLWMWSLKQRGAPTALASPPELRLPITHLTRDGTALWVRGADGRALALQLQTRPHAPASLTEVASPLTLPPPSPELALPVGDQLLRAQRGGVVLRWGEQKILSPPVYDLALLDSDHVAVATDAGISVYRASKVAKGARALRLTAELKLASRVSALLYHGQTLYILGPKIGVLWAEPKPPLNGND